MIHLFNTENYKDKPFSTFTIEQETKEIRNMKFSPNGKHILLITRQNLLLLLDAFQGTITQKLEGSFSGVASNEHSMLLQHSTMIEAGFSPDSRYVVTGSANPAQNLFMWNAETGKEVKLMQFHPGTVACVKFSHLYCMLITACQNVVVWIPGSIVAP